jgi:hypothetical protein
MVLGITSSFKADALRALDGLSRSRSGTAT